MRKHADALGPKLRRATLARYRSVRAAAQRAGIHYQVLGDWVRGRRRPRPSNFWPALKRLRIPRDGFRKLVPPIREIPACKYCGKPILEPTYRQILRKDPQRKGFWHRECRADAKEGWRTVHCTSCPTRQLLPPTRIRQLKWTEERNGTLYYHCGRCSRRERAHPERLREGVLMKLRDEPVIEKYYRLHEQNPPASVLEALALLRHDYRAVSGNKELGDLLLREHLRAITPRGWNLGQGTNSRKSLHQGVAQVVRGRLGRGGFFDYCLAGCGKLHYVFDTTRLSAYFHKGKCWQAFCRSPEYRRWTGWRHQQLTALPPLPKLPARRGRPANRQTHLQRYRWLMRLCAPRQLGGWSVTKLAKSHGVSRRTIHKGVNAFRRDLPDSWDLVFQHRRFKPQVYVHEMLFPLTPEPSRVSAQRGWHETTAKRLRRRTAARVGVR